MTSAAPPRNWWASLALATMFCLAAAAAPFAATAIAYRVLLPAGRLTTISVGFVTGLAVGQIVGVRRGGLGSFILGPAIGMAIGYLDLKCFVWLFVNAEMPLTIVTLLPIWGAGFGIWIACYRHSWRARIAVASGMMVLCFVSQAVWQTLASYGLFRNLGGWLPYLEPTVYVAPAIAAVLMTPRRPRGRQAPTSDSVLSD